MQNKAIILYIQGRSKTKSIGGGGGGSETALLGESGGMPPRKIL